MEQVYTNIKKIRVELNYILAILVICVIVLVLSTLSINTQVNQNRRSIESMAKSQTIMTYQIGLLVEEGTRRKYYESKSFDATLGTEKVRSHY